MGRNIRVGGCGGESQKRALVDSPVCDGRKHGSLQLGDQGLSRGVAGRMLAVVQAQALLEQAVVDAEVLPRDNSRHEDQVTSQLEHFLMGVPAAFR